MSLLNMIFGRSKKNIKEYLEKGAVIVDVRTEAEFEVGHVSGSMNIPLDEIGKRKIEIKKLNKPVILCCASGMRSGRASQLLSNEGIDCINGRGWMSVKNQLNKSTEFKLF